MSKSPAITALPLPRDTALHLPSITVVSASAGAGKTHALTLRFLQLLLSRAIPRNDLSNIIALTFTTNAATEMRRRVVENLKRLALGADPDLAAQMLALVECTPEELQARALGAIEAILDRFSEFQVKTIDSFMTRLFKASSIELGYPAECDILLTTKPIVEYAFDVYAREEAGSAGGQERLRALAGMLTEMAGDGGRFPWDPYGKIVRETGALREQLLASPRPLGTGGSASDREAVCARLRTIAADMEQAVAGAGLELQVHVAGDLELVRAGRWRELLDRARRTKIVKSPAGKEGKQRLAPVSSALQDLLDRFNAALEGLTIAYAQTHYLPFVTALQNVSATIDRVKRQRSEISLDDINRHLALFLTTGAVTEIFEILGERLSHYLLDEFQDTSPVQWAGLRVLVENAIAEGGSLFAVGDTKQSIYGFRGADWTIMKGLMEARETFSGMRAGCVSLDWNWRSGGVIVEYVRQVFQERALLKYAPAAHASGLSTYCQHPLEGKRSQGHVEVSFVDPSAGDHQEREILLDAVESALARGHARGDIAILAPSNADILKIGDWLNRRGIPLLSYSSLDVRARSVVGELLGLLRFLNTPLDDLAFASFILGDVFEASLASRSSACSSTELRGRLLEERDRRNHRPLYIAFRELFPEEWMQFLGPLFDRVGYVPLYDLVADAFKTFSVLERHPEERAGLVQFLEAVKEFEDHGASSLEEFLAFAADWSVDNERWSVGNQSNPDAVSVMTIHKAKGLQFPVVIVVHHDRHLRLSSMVVREAGDSLQLWKVTSGLAKHSAGLAAVREEETLRAETDFLNRLYVSLTRAKEELYIISIRGKGGLPSGLLPEGPSKREDRRPIVRKVSPSVPLCEPVFHGIRMQVREEDLGRVGFLETERGDLMHKVLAQMEYVTGDPAQAVRDAMLREPAIRSGDPAAAGLEDTLCIVLREPEIRTYFEPRQGRKVRNEQELLGKDGTLFRVDRLLEDEGTVTVVDFKTGKLDTTGTHARQIAQYMHLLREIFPRRVIKGVVIYLDLRQIVEVTEPGGPTA